METGQVFAYNTGMRRLPRSPLFVLVEYVLALLLVGLTTGVLHLFGSVLDTQIATVGYLVPVVISTLVWGLGPGIAAAIAAFFAFNYFFIEPRFTLSVTRSQDLLVLAVFLAVAAVLNQLLGRTRSALERRAGSASTKRCACTNSARHWPASRPINRLRAPWHNMRWKPFRPIEWRCWWKHPAIKRRPASACRPIDRLRPIGLPLPSRPC